MPRTQAPSTVTRPEWRPFDDAAIYRLDEATAERMALSFKTLQNLVYSGRLTYVQYTKGRRLRGCDLNDWLAARVVTPDAEAVRVPDPLAVARGQASARIRAARRTGKRRRVSKG